MVINDTEGKFFLKVDKQRRIVYEKNVGLWNEDDFKRFHAAYTQKVMPYLGKGSWAKYDDLREYKPSTTISPELMNMHMSWGMENGYKCAAVLVDSATLKMQLNRSVKSMGFSSYYTDKEAEMDNWLKSQGF